MNLKVLNKYYPEVAKFTFEGKSYGDGESIVDLNEHARRNYRNNKTTYGKRFELVQMPNKTITLLGHELQIEIRGAEYEAFENSFFSANITLNGYLTLPAEQLRQLETYSLDNHPNNELFNRILDRMHHTLTTGKHKLALASLLASGYLTEQKTVMYPNISALIVHSLAEYQTSYGNKKRGLIQECNYKIEQVISRCNLNDEFVEQADTLFSVGANGSFYQATATLDMVGCINKPKVKNYLKYLYDEGAINLKELAVISYEYIQYFEVNHPEPKNNGYYSNSGVVSVKEIGVKNEINSYRMGKNLEKHQLEEYRMFDLFKRFCEEYILTYKADVVKMYFSYIHFLKQEGIAVTSENLETKFVSKKAKEKSLRNDGFPECKIALFSEISEKKPLEALSLLSSRRKLTKKQKEKYGIE